MINVCKRIKTGITSKRGSTVVQKPAAVERFCLSLGTCENAGFKHVLRRLAAKLVYKVCNLERGSNTPEAIAVMPFSDKSLWQYVIVSTSRQQPNAYTHRRAGCQCVKRSWRYGRNACILRNSSIGSCRQRKPAIAYCWHRTIGSLAQPLTA